MIVFDLETTHQEPTLARIVSAYIGHLDASGQVVNEREFLVRPEGFVIPEESTKIHGITHEHAATEGQPLATVLAEIAGFITYFCGSLSAPLAGQNISYDLTVLDREAARAFGPGASVADILPGVSVLDSYVLDKELEPYRKGSGSRKLVPLAAAYGVHLTEAEAHGARADAIAAGRIVQAQLRDPRLSFLALPELHERQIVWREKQQASLQGWYRSAKAGARQDPNMVANGSWPFIPRDDEAVAA